MAGGFGSSGGTDGGYFGGGGGGGTSVTIKTKSNNNKPKSSSGGNSVAKNNSTLNQSIAEGISTFNTLTGGKGLDRVGNTQEYADSLERSKAGSERAEKGVSRAEKGVSRAELGVERADLAINRYRKRAAEGIGTAEREAQRTNMAQQMAQAQQMAGLRLGAMAGGAQGSSAAAQQRSLQAQGMQALAGVERDIFLQSEAAKREGEDKLSLAERGKTLAEQGVTAAEQNVTAAEANVTAADLATSRLQMEKATFDIGQANAEIEMKTGLAMGIESQKSAERSAQIAADAQVKAGQAQSSGISVVCTELHSQGVINTQVWKDSEAWGAYMGKADREFMKAYWAIGIPTVKLMQRSKIASAILGPIFKQGFDYLGGKRTFLTKAGFLLGVGLCEISRHYLRLKNKMKVHYASI